MKRNFLAVSYNCCKFFAYFERSSNPFSNFAFLQFKGLGIFVSCYFDFTAFYCIFIARYSLLVFMTIKQNNKKRKHFFVQIFCSFFCVILYFDFILICFEMSMIDFNCFATCKKIFIANAFLFSGFSSLVRYKKSKFWFYEFHFL